MRRPGLPRRSTAGGRDGGPGRNLPGSPVPVPGRTSLSIWAKGALHGDLGPRGAPEPRPGGRAGLPWGAPLPGDEDPDAGAWRGRPRGGGASARDPVVLGPGGLPVLRVEPSWEAPGRGRPGWPPPLPGRAGPSWEPPLPVVRSWRGLPVPWDPAPLPCELPLEPPCLPGAPCLPWAPEPPCLPEPPAPPCLPEPPEPPCLPEALCLPGRAVPPDLPPAPSWRGLPVPSRPEPCCLPSPPCPSGRRGRPGSPEPSWREGRPCGPGLPVPSWPEGLPVRLGPPGPLRPGFPADPPPEPPLPGPGPRPPASLTGPCPALAPAPWASRHSRWCPWRHRPGPFPRRDGRGP